MNWNKFKRRFNLYLNTYSAFRRRLYVKLVNSLIQNSPDAGCTILDKYFHGQEKERKLARMAIDEIWRNEIEEPPDWSDEKLAVVFGSKGMELPEHRSSRYKGVLRNYMATLRDHNQRGRFVGLLLDLINRTKRIYSFEWIKGELDLISNFVNENDTNLKFANGAIRHSGRLRIGIVDMTSYLSLVKKMQELRIKFKETELSNNNRYDVYEGPTRPAALDFLRSVVIKNEREYIVVETPKGDFGKDMVMIYNEATQEKIEDVELHQNAPENKNNVEKSSLKKNLSPEEILVLQAEPISKMRRTLLWLDPKMIFPKSTHIDPFDGESLIIENNDVDWFTKVDSIAEKASTASGIGNFNEAINLYLNALKLAPGSDLYLMSIGACYANLGEDDKALHFLERAYKINPKSERIKKNLEMIKGK